jgi:hypothetical protein
MIDQFKFSTCADRDALADEGFLRVRPSGLDLEFPARPPSTVRARSGASRQRVKPSEKLLDCVLPLAQNAIRVRIEFPRLNLKTHNRFTNVS